MMCRKEILRAAKVAAFISATAALFGCQALREATGFTKTSPDEFLVVRRPPLVIPPDLKLRPPQPGAAPRFERTASAQAQNALYPESASTLLATSESYYSDGEKLLLSRANALTTDPGIRRIVDAEADQNGRGSRTAGKVFERRTTPAPQLANAGQDYSDGEKLLLSKANALGVDPGIRNIVNAEADRGGGNPQTAGKVLDRETTPAPQLANAGPSTDVAESNNPSAVGASGENIPGEAAVSHSAAMNEVPPNPDTNPDNSRATVVAAAPREALKTIVATTSASPIDTLYLLRPAYER